MKERRSFSCGCAKIHELPTSVFLLSFCLSSLCLSCLSCLSLSRPLPLESRVIASSVVSRRVSPRREESRVIASSVVVVAEPDSRHDFRVPDDRLHLQAV